MPKASKTTASDSMVVDGYEGHFENFDGGYTVSFRSQAVKPVEPNEAGCARRRRRALRPGEHLDLRSRRRGCAESH